MTEAQWLGIRKPFVGGSEIATICAMRSPELARLIYDSPVNLWLSKIGEDVPKFEGNLHTELGKDLEPVIAHNYKYWDHKNPDPMLMYKNKREGKPFTKVRHRKVVVFNRKHPQAIGTPDRFIGRDGLLECKKTTTLEQKRYENGISPLV